MNGKRQVKQLLCTWYKPTFAVFSITLMILLSHNLFVTLIALSALTPIECFHSHGQHLFKFIGTKESVCIRKEFNSHRIGLGHQHGRRFVVLGHQYGRHDVMWKHSIQGIILCRHHGVPNFRASQPLRAKILRFWTYSRAEVKRREKSQISQWKKFQRELWV